MVKSFDIEVYLRFAMFKIWHWAPAQKLGLSHQLSFEYPEFVVVQLQNVQP